MGLIRAIAGAIVWVALVALYALILTIAMLTPRRATARIGHRSGTAKMLVVGRVNSVGWCRSHILPLADCGVIGDLVALVDGPMIQHALVRRVYPPAWLSTFLGRTLARSLWLFKVVSAEKPDVIMAYSFFPAGLLGLLAARIQGARIVYQVTGGPVELEGGGINHDLPYLRIPQRLAAALCPLALRLCRQFDLVVGRGDRTRRFLRQRAGCARVEIIPGSVDAQGAASLNSERPYDIVFVGRLVSVKRPFDVLEIAHRLVPTHPSLRVAILGDGPLRESLHRRAEALALLSNVEFIGHSDEVERFLSRSKVFLLTSRSEGLSIALAEAMVAGAVPVVSDVGDLADLVDDGQTGWRLSPGDVDGFAARISHLLLDRAQRETLAVAAQSRALSNNSLHVVTAKWAGCLGALV